MSNLNNSNITHVKALTNVINFISPSCPVSSLEFVTIMFNLGRRVVKVKNAYGHTCCCLLLLTCASIYVIQPINCFFFFLVLRGFAEQEIVSFMDAQTTSNTAGDDFGA